MGEKDTGAGEHSAGRERWRREGGWGAKNCRRAAEREGLQNKLVPGKDSPKKPPGTYEPMAGLQYYCNLLWLRNLGGVDRTLCAKRMACGRTRRYLAPMASPWLFEFLERERGFSAEKKRKE